MYIHPLYHWPPKSKWLQQPLNPRKWGLFSSYIHFPFCRNICDFCGYETRLISRTAADTFPRLAVQQIEQEIKSADFTDSKLRAVFFGGGTASLMTETGLGTILTTLLQFSNASNAPEATLECEPGTIDRASLELVKSYGINRISVCAQALSDAQLVIIGRKHTNAQSLRLIDDCVAVGLKNIHVDLMY